MNKGRTLAFVFGLLVLVAVLIYGSLGTVRAECELCVQYNGRTECRKGSGADEQEARQAAQKAACALMAVGMAESIKCQNVVPTGVLCEN